jgi:PAS domain S-box-containing protein
MPKKLNILHLEDSDNDAELIEASLLEGGIDCEIVRVEGRDDFVTLLKECSFDLILADRSTPSFDGFTALQLARQLRSSVPFIFVSGTIDENSAINSLQEGATDYVLKHRLARLVPAVERAVTEIQQREELNRSLQLLKEQAELLDRASDIIIIRDLDERITYWNSGAERVYGWSKAEVEGQLLHKLLRTEFFRPVADVQAELLQTGHWEGELEHTRRDGTRALLESRWTLRRDANGRPTSILEIATDVTDRRRLQAQLVQAQKLESLGTLAGGIAHDFNNILGIVIGYASILEMTEGATPDVREISTTLQAAGERGAGLVRQLLTFARKTPTTFLPMSLNGLVEDIAKMISHTFPKNIELVKQLEPDLKCILGDVTQMHQLLLNLCVNARDAMPNGGTLKIETSVVTGDVVRLRCGKATEAEYIHLRVSDTGMGMSAETQQHLFEPFYTTKEVGKGTGLGLAVVYGAVESHRGCIQVESAVGAGTAFSLFFPAIESAAELEASTTGAPVSRGAGELILVVEDEMLLRDLIRSVLESHGYTVIQARDGVEGLAIFRERSTAIRLVISDLEMAKMSGLQMLQRMRESGPTPPLLLCSGYLDPSLASQLEAAGVTEFLLKPCRPRQIIAKVHEMLSRTKHAHC